MIQQTSRRRHTYVVFLFQVDPASVLADTEFFFLGQLLDFPIVLFVSDGGCWSQEERAQDHGGDEGETEESERVLR